MIRPRHPEASALAVLIGCGKISEYEAPARAIETMFAGWSDERKADLYARIADTVLDSDAFAEVERKVNDALWDNQGCHLYA